MAPIWAVPGLLDFYVASNFYYDFTFMRKNFPVAFNFYQAAWKVHIKVLAASLSLEDVQTSLSSSYNLIAKLLSVIALIERKMTSGA